MLAPAPLPSKPNTLEPRNPRFGHILQHMEVSEREFGKEEGREGEREGGREKGREEKESREVGRRRRKRWGEGTGGIRGVTAPPAWPQQQHQGGCRTARPEGTGPCAEFAACGLRPLATSGRARGARMGVHAAGHRAGVPGGTGFLGVPAQQDRAQPERRRARGTERRAAQGLRGRTSGSPASAGLVTWAAAPRERGRGSVDHTSAGVCIYVEDPDTRGDGWSLR